MTNGDLVVGDCFKINRTHFTITRIEGNYACCIYNFKGRTGNAVINIQTITEKQKLRIRN